MKKLLVSTLLTTAALVGFGGAQNDMRVYFETKGPDTYKDGTQVLDGEFYALVWTRADAFAGFNADGSFVNEADEVVAYAPYAKGGRLPFTAEAVPAAKVPDYADGSFAVVSLDTRKADGTLSAPAVKDGRRVPSAVNGYATASFVGVQAAAASAVLDFASPVSLATVAPAPNAPTPVITSVAKVGDSLVVKVKGTADYLRYNVAGGSTPDAVGGDGIADPKDGAADEESEIELVVPVDPKASSGFFKVIRN